MSKKEMLQKLWKEFEETHEGGSLTINDCFHWALESKRWTPRPMELSKIFTREMSSALRQEYRVDASGNKYRARLCYRENREGTQLSLWADADKCTKNFAGKAIKQRRQGVVNDCYQLKQDVNHLNEYRFKNTPIPLVLDFTDDVAELEAERNADNGLNAA